MRSATLRACRLLLLLPVGACAGSYATTSAPGEAEPALGVAGPASSPYEVWILDQSDTRTIAEAGFGGQLLIYDGAALTGGDPAAASPTRIDLAGATARLCWDATAKRPVRPHMILFNDAQSHAVVSFVASGHVVIFDAARREPLACFLTTQSPTTQGQQAHAAFPAPDGSYILVANQNGKRLERIDTDYATNSFVHRAEATLDLATCTTPAGRPCEDPELRPLNWPICPIIDASSRYGFVTLRGGGLFVVDAKQTPMRIAAEYDARTVKGNGCGGVQVDGAMFINSGGSPVRLEDDHPHKFGFDVYRFPVAGYPGGGENLPSTAPIFSKSGQSDSHGMVATGRNRYLWVMDRHQDVVEILAVATGERVNTLNLAGALSDNPAPDLADTSPSGDYVFVSLRGPVPLSGDPHNATGSTPGVGVIRVTENGRSGSFVAVVPITNPHQQGNQQPDPHGIRVRSPR